ncbi:formylglycine-generating enzyme family protein [Bdellovibrio sp. ZAP7]|uniref:formylglycine-generating enzyme family protein n=1 Tax=Bdellovibrio sp. ZAP7 TaxID=2231053 RepID=UPI001AEFD321|nr:formylglycine-generating enzyme family protein [Bdellovibrio sp. ZAP7]
MLTKFSRKILLFAAIIIGLGFFVGGSTAISQLHSPFTQGDIAGLPESDFSDDVAAAMKPSNPNFGQSMVWIPGGEFWMGSNNPSVIDAQPEHRVHIDGFWMDQYLVTNRDFMDFVDETGYVTVAERRLDPKDYPDLPAELLAPGAIIFSPRIERTDLGISGSVYWRWQPGANWRHPEGPGSDLRGRELMPVIHVSYADAEAYANFRGKRLPTEAEWEYAARGGLDRMPFSWGKDFRPSGKFMANTWQGNFPYFDSAEDGFKGLSPVGSFPPNGYGLYDMTGNVWQWVSDWYRADYFKHQADKVTVNPQGPKSSEKGPDPSYKKRVQKGGSYLCTDSYCSNLDPGARRRGDVWSGSPQVGFRLVTSEPANASFTFKQKFSQYR